MMCNSEFSFSAHPDPAPDIGVFQAVIIVVALGGEGARDAAARGCLRNVSPWRGIVVENDSVGSVEFPGDDAANRNLESLGLERRRRYRDDRSCGHRLIGRRRSTSADYDSPRHSRMTRALIVEVSGRRKGA